MSEHEHDEPITEESVQEANEPAPGTEQEPDEEPGTDAPMVPEGTPDEERDPEAVMEEIGKKLDTLTRTVATRISSILGDVAVDFTPCEMCGYFNTPGWRYGGPLPADLTEQLLHLLNQHAPSEYIADTHSTACSHCNGLGMVLSGSKAQGQEILPCIECESLGWLPTDDARRRGRLSLANGEHSPGMPPSGADAAMSPALAADSPEIRALKEQGYVVIPPMVNV